MNRRNQPYPARRARSMQRNQNSVSYVSAVKLGPVANTVIIALLITVLGLIYLTQATKATGYDRQIQKIDTEIAELAVQKSDLEIENARLTALKTIESSSVAANMTQPEDIRYVAAP